MQAVVVLARNYWNLGDFSGVQRKQQAESISI